MTIIIENLSFETIIGILDYERQTPQNVEIDCSIEYTYTPGIFINYAEVASLIETTMQTKKFELIETAIETLSHLLKEQFSSIQTLTLTIRKPNILSNCTVGVKNHFIF